MLRPLVWLHWLPTCFNLPVQTGKHSLFISCRRNQSPAVQKVEGKQSLPPAVHVPHLSAPWGFLPAAWSPSSCGCGSVLSDWGSQRVPGLELRSGTSFTGCSRAGVRSAEGRGEPSHDPCLGPPGATVLLIRSGARATWEGFNILNTPGQPRDLAGSGVNPPLAVYGGASRDRRGWNGGCRNHWRMLGPLDREHTPNSRMKKQNTQETLLISPYHAFSVHVRVLRCNFGWKAVVYDAEFFCSMKTWQGELHKRLIHVKIQSRKK